MQDSLASVTSDLSPTSLTDKIGKWIHNYLIEAGLSDYSANLVKALVLAFLVFLFIYLINAVTKRYIVKTIERVIRKTKSKYDDFLIQRKVFQRLSHLVPAVVIFLFVGIVFRDFPVAGKVVKKVTLLYIVGAVIWSLNSFFNVIQDIYNTFSYSHERPIKGYIQVLQIIFYCIGGLIFISIVFEVDLIAVFASLGAMAAVLLLIFKDTILGFVASIQLSANKMLRIGDWISMPSHNADGTVLEITLNTVKVQNWDKTIVTIPTYSLVANSFSNWRGMEESGGRRIKRSINIDMKSVKFCTPQMLEKFKKITFLKDYIETSEKEMEAYNLEAGIDDSVLVNGRRMTNLGVFRRYLEEYLQRHPKIHNDMTFLVRHLQPTDRGLPIEIYVFSNDQEWANYESIQADIFDHTLAVIPEFELRAFQLPTGDDLRFFKE
ncbi:mechanosensitive ion channel family protein [Marinilabiliaceae bacterium JC017]|nr:mechanosensitive ion channel family protein [Marinilabiliaceae bacterium JC017]